MPRKNPRNEFIGVPVTENEKRRLLEAAESAQRTLADYVRVAALATCTDAGADAGKITGGRR